MNPFARKLAERLVRRGTLHITDTTGAIYHFGDGSGRIVHIKVNNRQAEKAIAYDPALKLGECYMNGDIDLVACDMYDLLELIFTNAEPRTTAARFTTGGRNRLRRLLTRFRQWNTLGRSRNNVRHHYDLSGDLYDLFLDRDRQYSCAYFSEPNMDIDAAQLAKKNHIAAKLFMKRKDLSVLDIGSGWGGMGLHLAQHFDADVTGITLSQEQHAYSTKRIAPADEHRVRFLLKDYRHVEDRFDRIVSVGMFEHVGVPNYDTYFRQCAKLLKDDGVMVLHSIGRTDSPTWTNPFIAKYIFPGGYIPSLSEVLPSIERAGLYVTDVEILRLHYAETLKVWRERFMARREEAKALYDEKFCRMWEFYLAASESAFRWQDLMVFQIQLTHEQAAVPLTRDYIHEDEQRIAEASRPVSGKRRRAC